MRKLAIIPARGGSKRFPKKNISILDDKPLICHTIEAASNMFDTIIVSSDDEEVLNISREWYRGYSLHQKGPAMIDEVLFYKRPSFLSTDYSRVIDTIKYYFDEYQDVYYEYIFLLLPTCPLRTKDDIGESVSYLVEDHECDSVVSITDYEFPPSLGLGMNAEGYIEDIHPSKPFKNNNTRSQDFEKVWRPNGAIYGSKWSSFKKYRNFFGGNVRGYVMPRERSVDIDSSFDLKVAEMILKEQKERGLK